MGFSQVLLIPDIEVLSSTNQVYSLEFRLLIPDSSIERVVLLLFLIRFTNSILITASTQEVPESSFFVIVSYSRLSLSHAPLISCILRLCKAWALNILMYTAKCKKERRCTLKIILLL
jgi:hypothetical protein